MSITIATPSTRPGEVVDQIQSIASIAPSLIQFALQAGSDLTATIGAAPVITPQFPDPIAAPTLETPTAPAVVTPTWVAPGLPSEFTEVLATGDLEVEPFDVDAPTIVYGSAPAAFSDTLPEAMPVNLVFDDPTLAVTLPSVPNLLSISIAPFSGVNLTTFDEDAPTLTIAEPTIREYYAGPLYSSDLLTALTASLESRIGTGGTGLDPDVESAIWDRGREREARSARDALADLDRMESLGYAFPPGAYLDARIKIATETDYANRGHSREVMIKVAELALENVKHALTTAVQIEGQLISYNNSVEQRAFDACKYATDAGVQIYNAKVQAFASMVEVYKAKIQAYEALVRTEVQRVEVYKTQVSAEEAKARVNVALVDQYKAQVDAALSAVEIYKAEIAGIQTKAEIEKTKVMIFGEQVRAYAAKVNAYTAGVEGFRATLEGEKTKAQVYQAQVEAFSARVRAGAEAINARVTAYRGRIEANTARWDGYKAQTQAEASRVQSITAVNSAVADIYKARISGVSSYNDTLTKQWQATVDQNQRVAEIAISAAKANAELSTTARSLATDAAKVSAQVAGQLGAAALNIVNLSASVSSAEAFSIGYSRSDSSSESDSRSYSENYNYSV